QVISQSPASGTSVSSGSAVNLVVSTGAAAISVPNLVGQTQTSASTAITNAGLTVGTITQQASQSVPAGQVISQSIAAGSAVSSGSVVNLVISSGPAVSVPSVVGQTQAAALTAIANAGLTVGTVTQEASQSVPAGQVISQSIAAGSAVSGGSIVNLIISSGPAVSVPSVVGQTQAAALTAIANAGLTVGTVTQQASQSVPAGQVISQSIAAGSAVSGGSIVNLVVSSGPAPSVTNFSAATATGSGVASVVVSGGGIQCGFSQSMFLPVAGASGSPPAGSAPVGVSFPHGLFAFTVTSCTRGGSVAVAITYPQSLPSNTQYWKYGPTPGNQVAHWYVIPATVNGNVVTFSITDGGIGDDDVSVNGTIIDQGGPGVPGGSGSSADARPIPTLSDALLGMLIAMLAAVSAVQLRSRTRNGSVRHTGRSLHATWRS
ncbi:MAG: PASTA domain-containing protein, partial [Pseudomonadota bacterium]|nr:PASTA domain-containing protein [Pseudomonadota bacterium]